MEKLIRAYIYSVGSMLLALATIFMLANFQTQPTDFVFAHEAVFNLKLPVLYWIASGLFFVAALICLFGRQISLQLTAILWFATTLMGYQIGLYGMGAKGGVQGYLGIMSDVFGTSTSTMYGLLGVIFGYLLTGGFAAMTLVWLSEQIRIRQEKVNVKTACAHCGGHIQFSLRNLGQQIPCPHCQTDIVLRRPDENLKTTCYFCKEHIQFPAHALGEKISCPHCNMGITLKEPA